MILKKIALIATLVVAGVIYLGWLPKDRADRFVRVMLAVFAVGFAWRVGAWIAHWP